MSRIHAYSHPQTLRASEDGVCVSEDTAHQYIYTIAHMPNVDSPGLGLITARGQQCHLRVTQTQADVVRQCGEDEEGPAEGAKVMSAHSPRHPWTPMCVHLPEFWLSCVTVALGGASALHVAEQSCVWVFV